MPNTFWWLLNFERHVHVYLSFRCIFLICSCHLNNHPSILWTILYPSPDDGYYNRNVNVDFTSWYIHLFGLYFFLLPSYIYIYIYMNVSLCKHIFLYIYISLYMNICMCIYMYMYIYTCISIHIYIYIYVCAYICVYIKVCIFEKGLFRKHLFI